MQGRITPAGRLFKIRRKQKIAPEGQLIGPLVHKMFHLNSAACKNNL